MTYRNRSNIFILISFIITTTFVFSMGCTEYSQFGIPTVDNCSNLTIHSVYPIVDRMKYEIEPGYYTFKGETLNEKSELSISVYTFDYKSITTDRFGNVNEEWKTAPAPRFNSNDPIIQIASTICESDANSICDRTVPIATGYIGTPVRNLNIVISCRGDCNINISKSDQI